MAIATEPELGRRHDMPRPEGCRLAKSAGPSPPHEGFFSSRRGSLRCVKPSRLMLAASECVVLSRWTRAQRGATIARRCRGALWNVNGARWRLFPGSYPCCGRGGPRGRGGRAGLGSAVHRTLTYSPSPWAAPRFLVHLKWEITQRIYMLTGLRTFVR